MKPTGMSSDNGTGWGEGKGTAYVLDVPRFKQLAVGVSTPR